MCAAIASAAAFDGVVADVCAAHACACAVFGGGPFGVCAAIASAAALDGVVADVCAANALDGGNMYGCADGVTAGVCAASATAAALDGVDADVCKSTGFVSAFALGVPSAGYSIAKRFWACFAFGGGGGFAFGTYGTAGCGCCAG